MASCLAWFLTPRPYLCLCFPSQWVGYCLFPASFHKHHTSRTKHGSYPPPCWEHLQFLSTCRKTKMLGSCGFRLAVSVLFLIYEKVCFGAWFCLFGFLFVYFSYHCYLCAVKGVDQNIILLYQLEQKSFCIFIFSFLSHHPFLYNLHSSHS